MSEFIPGQRWQSTTEPELGIGRIETVEGRQVVIAFPARDVVRRYATADPPLSRGEVEQLTAAGVSEAVVLELVDRRGAAPLSADDLVALKKAGAGDTVLDRMIANEREEPATVAWDVPVTYHRSTYYHRSWYPYVGFGFGYGYGYRRCGRGGWSLGFGW